MPRVRAATSPATQTALRGSTSSIITEDISCKSRAAMQVGSWQIRCHGFCRKTLSARTDDAGFTIIRVQEVCVARIECCLREAEGLTVFRQTQRRERGMVVRTNRSVDLVEIVRLFRLDVGVLMDRF